ncbi:ABC transporter ATP-binding protein [Microlunatus soli]|uniref:ATP-binding cassette, subfamily C n=1 Tax=Microlunatus soli TaxID=630515 RepID=A0A1H1SVX0_9ACTN|nr:ABC transporter ATP-binding protein [Microlunatus soli]SDS52140.1 ATP-binding cassette, subfamily C [Microlunatus soli]
MTAELVAAQTEQSEDRAVPTADAGRTWRVVGRIAWRQPWLVLSAIISSLLAAGLSVMAPYLLGSVVDLVIDRGTVRQLLGLIALVVLVAAAGAVATRISYALVGRLGADVLAELREQVMDRALTVDARVLERAGTGEITARVTGDVAQVSESTSQLVSLSASLLTVLATAVGFLTLDWRLALAFLTVMPVYVLALRWYLLRAPRLYAAERVAVGRRGQTVLASISGAETVHAYGTESRHSDRVNAASRGAIGATLRAFRTLQTFMNTMNLAEAVGLGALLLTGFLLVGRQDVTVGAVTAAALMFHRLFGPLGFLLMTFDDVQAAGAALARLVGVADLRPPQRQPERPVPERATLSGAGISHRYGDADVLHGVDLTIAAGERVAVVGASGAGKTTVAAILGGVFPATAGAVMIADDPIDRLDPEQIRRRVALVSQEVHVFTGTLADDLRLAAPDADDDQLRDALWTVGARGWVDALPQGLQTVVGEGAHRLTAAQAQQLALARVVLADPPVLILDEATAEAGSAGARALEDSARAALEGRTAVVVAHRLSQAQECDRIVVMDDGRVVEQGSHQELVDRGGSYARLWQAWHA